MSEITRIVVTFKNGVEWEAYKSTPPAPVLPTPKVGDLVRLVRQAGTSPNAPVMGSVGVVRSILNDWIYVQWAGLRTGGTFDQCPNRSGWTVRADHVEVV